MSASTTWGDVRDIHCCWNKSDLCFKSQVEKDERNVITQVTKSGNSYTTRFVDVSTHRKRYDFCQANPDDIYCQVDPEGDANTEPEGPACAEDSSCNCGDHHCTVADCDSTWKDLNPNSTDRCKHIDDPDWTQAKAKYADDIYGDTGTYSSSIDETDGTSQQCTITTGCRAGTVGRDTPYFKTNTITDDIDELSFYLFCTGGVLQRGGC